LSLLLVVVEWEVEPPMLQVEMVVAHPVSLEHHLLVKVVELEHNLLEDLAVRLGFQAEITV
jgi:hypothetical protein